jgi:predicted RNase H-related nuclease YkuK (DUF458 family)
LYEKTENGVKVEICIKLFRTKIDTSTHCHQHSITADSSKKRDSPTQATAIQLERTTLGAIGVMTAREVDETVEPERM